MTPQAALIELMLLPDPVDLPRRAHHLTQTGDPLRQETEKVRLERAWLRWRRFDVGLEESEVIR